MAGLLALAFILPACREERTGDTYSSIRKLFEEPPAGYRPVPFWVWNDRMTEKQIREQLADFKARGMGGVFVHPRPGLITPYLSDEWFRLFRCAVETGRELGLQVWIYDENSYPSGFAGGHVPAAMPEAVRAGLKLVKIDGEIGIPSNDVAAVFRRIPTGYKDVTAAFERDGSVGLGAGSYAVIEIVKSKPSPWHGGFSYVDLMKKGVTDKFLDLTLNGYKKAVGREFGATVPGVFQDEAEIGPEGGADAVNYSAELFAAFQRRWGYDLKPELISLFEQYGEWRRVRYNYYSTLLDLFIENWAKPYYAYCVDNNLIFTGHYWEHAWPSPRNGPDNLAMAAYAHMPGIDILMNRFDRGPDSQFGNARSVREIRSAANQFGRERTLSETYGAGGWDLTFADQKRIGDWEYALGVNFLNQHLSYASIKGARKRDHPLSFSYHEPWWPLYDSMTGYFGRLSAVLSKGQQRNRILVIEPTTSAWMYYSPSGKNEKADRIGEDFQRFINMLEENHIEYDLASERTIQESGSVKFRRFVLGLRSYELVVLPPGLEGITDSTMALLREYLLHHGRIMSWVAPPDYVNGIATEDIRQIQRSYSDRWTNSGPDGMAVLRAFQKDRGEVSFEEPESNPWLFHQRRIFDDGQMIFLANTGLEEPARGKVILEGRSVERWDPFTGKVQPYPFEKRGVLSEVAYDIPPCGSLLLFLRKDGKAVPAAPADVTAGTGTRVEVPASGVPSVTRLGENVLTLDYCDLVLGGKTFKDLYFYDAQKKAYQYYGLDGDPWDNAVQYKTAILDRDNFQPGSGFEAAFEFTAAKGDVFDYSSLKAVVERPDVFRVFINGHEVGRTDGQWWLDRDFAVYAIGKYIVSGRNRITVKASPFSVHAELEPVYLLGDFRLEPASRGFVLRPYRGLGQGAWSEQGLPFYGGAVAYGSEFTVGDDAAGGRYSVELGRWSGAAATVSVNGTEAAFPPYTLDVSGLIKPGANRITVTVYGSLRNTLGPFHGDIKPGAAWPGDFKYSGPDGMPSGGGYSFLKYGLFEGFKLVAGRS